MTAPLSYRRQARTPTTAAVVGGVWAVLLAGWIWLDAAPWLVALCAAATLPALVDLIRNPESGLSMDADTISWFSGRRSATVSLSEIDRLRLDTRLDFSVRATLILKSGRKIRLPFEATPPHQIFEDKAQAFGLKTERFHFQLFQ